MPRRLGQQPSWLARNSIRRRPWEWFFAILAACYLYAFFAAISLGNLS